MRSPIRLPLLQIQPQVWGAKYTLTSDQLTVNVVFFIATLKFNNSRKWLEELWKMLYLLLQFLFCFILIFRRLKGCQLKSAKGKGGKEQSGMPKHGVCDCLLPMGSWRALLAPDKDGKQYIQSIAKKGRSFKSLVSRVFNRTCSLTAWVADC